MKRQIISIDEDLCTGCGACVPDCPEGALQIIDGKARLVGDLFCDGLGACIGACPVDAIHVEVREADPYDEKLVMRENIIPKGINTIKAHLSHLVDHGADTYAAEAMEVLNAHDPELHDELYAEFFGSAAESADNTATEIGCGSGGCPGSQSQSFAGNKDSGKKPGNIGSTHVESELNHWPIQMHLMNPSVPHFKQSDFLLAADCTAFSMGAFHPEMIKNHTLGIACPKLDNGLEIYRDKLIKLIDDAEINTLTVAVMEVPCCSGLVRIAADAVKAAKRNIPVKYIQIGIKGDILQNQWLQL